MQILRGIQAVVAGVETPANFQKHRDSWFVLDIAVPRNISSLDSVSYMQFFTLTTSILCIKTQVVKLVC